MRKGPLRNEVLHPLTHYLIVHPDCPCNCWKRIPLSAHSPASCAVDERCKGFDSACKHPTIARTVGVDTRSRAVSRQRDPLRRSEGPAGH
jgi:hypothetical protein